MEYDPIVDTFTVNDPSYHPLCCPFPGHVQMDMYRNETPSTSPVLVTPQPKLVMLMLAQ
jgi:hypothetical protein